MTADLADFIRRSMSRDLRHGIRLDAPRNVLCLTSPLEDAERENRDWRVKFALLEIHGNTEPNDDLLAPFVEACVRQADTCGSGFPYGPDVESWPDDVRAWFFLFVKELVRQLITPAERAMRL